jgi:hypothetical protein
MISHAMVAFGAPVLGFVVLAVLGWITVRSENRRKPHQAGHTLLLKASHVTYHLDGR